MRHNIKPIKSLEDIEDVTPFPTVTKAKLEELNNINEKEVVTSPKDDDALVVAGLGDSYTLNTDILDNRTEENHISNLTKDGKQYGVSSITFKNRGKSTRQRLGITTPVKVVLYNSGFIYVTNEVGVSDENRLKIAISELYKKIAIKTAGLSFSSDSLYYDDEVINFIESLINDGGWTNLEIGDNESIWDYVSIFDLPVIYLGLIKAINPATFKVFNACKNVIETEEIKKDDEEQEEDFEDIVGEDKPHLKTKCNSIIVADVIPDELHHINENKILIDELKQKRRTPENLKEYKEKIGIEEESFTVFIADNEIEIVLNDPSIAKYIERNELLLTRLANTVDEAIQEQDEDIKRIKIAQLFNDKELPKYCHFVEKIKFADGVAQTSSNDILDSLESFEKYPDIKDTIIQKIKNYISDKSITIVGIEEYICDKCKKEVKGIEEGYFKGIIPLNMQQLFFDIYNLRLG